jgi:hypothetical protein
MQQGLKWARRLIVIQEGRMLIPAPIVVGRSGASEGVAPPQIAVLGVTGELLVVGIFVRSPLSSMVDP